MSIKISWQNRNERATTIEIYRSAEKMDMLALPPAIATVAGDIDPPEYADEVPKPGESFYYMTATVDTATGAKVLSRQVQYTATQHRGPGPQELIYGDENFGFYGSVLTAELAVLTALYPWATEVTNTQYRWYKFVRNNKIIYCTDRPYGVPVGQTNVLSAKFRSGVPADKRAPVTRPGLYNDNILKINNFKLHIRCAYVMPDEWKTTDTAPTHNSIFSEKSRCELSDIMAAMGGLTDSVYGRLPLLNTLHDTNYIPHPVMGPESWTEYSSATNIHYPQRSTLNSSTTNVIRYPEEYQNVRAVTNYINSSASVFIMPVLELIED